MTPFLIAAVIIAAPFVFWFFRRRARPRAGRERSERLLATSALNADHINTATLEVAHPSDRLVSVEAEITPGKAGKEEPEEKPPTTFHAAASFQSQSEQDTSTPRNRESHPPEEENDAKTIAGDQTASNEQIPQAHTETFPECKTPAAHIGTPDVSDQEQPEAPIILSAAVAFTPGDRLQAEYTDQGTEVALIATQYLKEELTQANADAEQAQPPHDTEEPVDEDTEKAPQRYRPPPQRPPRQEAPAKTVNQEPRRAGRPSQVELEIRVRLKFDRFGLCEIGLLPERTPELDSEVVVRSAGISLHLVAQEDWYEDLQFENIGDHLRQGVELKGRLADHRRARWLLTGRNVYILASHQRASGFVSTNRLVLGRSHVLLCTAGILQQVEAILNQAGCQGYTKLDEEHGVPSGWAGLSGVAPKNAVPLNPGSDPFYPIKPAPDIEIELEGGVCLRNSVWLAGFPPRIRLFGQVNGWVKILIDGKEASHTADGSFAVEGYDQAGQQHSVYCEGFSCSRSYSIEDPPNSWKEWPAYHFGQADICGPLVRLTPEAASRRVFSVPMSNPILLGAEPGQIFRCSSRSVANWKGLVPFDVVWALPAQPLISNKKTVRILQFANAPLALANTHMKAALHWSTAILDASRKGLQFEKSSPDATVLWSEYKKAARNIWRATR